MEDLHPLFLGPYGENADLLEEIVTDLLRDHVYWRRNFHPENTPPIPTSARYRPDYIAFRAAMERELQRLSADLKRSVPFFSPRYIGHMASELLLPGLIAKIITTLYNPNNVSEEASPATLAKELEVGAQLARMVGYQTSPGANGEGPVAWGHITSGGSVANYQGLRNIAAIRLWPLALRAACEDHPDAARALSEAGHSPRQPAWALLNQPLEAVIAQASQVRAAIAARLPASAARAFAEALEERRYEARGLVGFFADHPDAAPPEVFVPVTAHYSWKKAMKLLGLGTAQLTGIAADRHMRMDVGALAAQLERCRERQIPVLAVVGVLGTTEFGTIDPLGEVFRLREAAQAQGQWWAVHVDAAWGGYLATLFRRPDGGVHPRELLRERFHYFPSQEVYEAFTSLHLADSITIDPHKLGYIPYAAGAYVARDRGMIDFLAEPAPYVFDVDGKEEDIAARLRHLGQYTMEGSKAGASVAAAYVTHRVVPLDSEGFGRILERSVRACEYFDDALGELRARLAGHARVELPIAPDTNLICLAVNPVGNTSLARMNRFSRALFEHLRVDARLPVQQREFIASYTSILRHNLSDDGARAICDALGLDAASFTDAPTTPDDADHLFVLRHTLMNPWLLFEEDGENYLDRYLAVLAGLLERVLAQEHWR